MTPSALILAVVSDLRLLCRKMMGAGSRTSTKSVWELNSQ